jgi:hypothetical protein
MEGDMCGECSGTPQASIKTIDRRRFLMLGGLAFAGMELALGSDPGMAQTSSGVSLAKEFEAASKRYGVPEELLLAMGYVNTLWEMPPPGASDYEKGDLHGRGAYGIMQLLQNPSRSTLDRAAALTGLSGSRLKTDRAANVQGGAAVLADLAGLSKPEGLEGWQDLVAEYAYGPLYSQEVYETLENGASLTTSTGESLTLKAQDVEAPTAYAAQDRAGLRRADYGRASWQPAARGNYTNANRGPRKIDFIVVHVVEGPKSSAINHFKNPSSDVSAHYVVGRSGGIAQCVRNEDIAWHAGNWPVNTRSIGIEHAGYGRYRSTWTDAMYRASARLSASVCRKYKVPVDRKHIVRHRKVSSTLCPGKHFDMDRYLRLVRKYK